MFFRTSRPPGQGLAQAFHHVNILVRSQGDAPVKYENEAKVVSKCSPCGNQAVPKGLKTI